jgi:hypothetical protein
MDGRIKEYYFDEINNMDDFDSIFEDEMEAMYQPIVDKKAAKIAAKDLSEEFIEETESDSLNDDTYGI